jgi:hypothetical protein
MDTDITHRVFGEHAEEALRAVEDEAVQLESLLSCFENGSEISWSLWEVWEVRCLLRRMNGGKHGMSRALLKGVVDALASKGK